MRLRFCSFEFFERLCPLSHHEVMVLMNIGLYAPQKPLGIGAPSGDAATVAGLHDFLRGNGHVVTQMSLLRTRNIFQDMALSRQVASERHKALDLAWKMKIDIWLTFHSYWKSPDLLGPWCCDRLGIPYVMHKAMYAQKRRRDRRSLAGFLVNRKALLRADAVFTDDANNMSALDELPGCDATLLLPGIDTAHFYPDSEAATRLLYRLGLRDKKIVATVAMFRPGVKVQSLKYLFESFARLDTNPGAHLIVAGDGDAHDEVHGLAREFLPERHTFVGRLEKDDLRALYSSADVFAFPGIGESLGMVYLEAMCCGTPVVGCMGSGPSQLVVQGKTGLLVEPDDVGGFARAVEQMLGDSELRTVFGQAGRVHVLNDHDLGRNLTCLETAMQDLVD